MGGGRSGQIEETGLSLKVSTKMSNLYIVLGVQIKGKDLVQNLIEHQENQPYKDHKLFGLLWFL